MNTPTLAQAVERLGTDPNGGVRSNPFLDEDPYNTLDRVATALEGIGVALSLASPEAVGAFLSSRAGKPLACDMIAALAHALDVAKDLLLDRDDERDGRDVAATREALVAEAQRRGLTGVSGGEREGATS